MKTFAAAISITLIGAPAFAADMAVKAPPPAPAPVPTWTGFYGGIQFGGGWSDDEAVNLSPNDPTAALVLSGKLLVGGQPVTASAARQSGPVGGLELGYNWQAGSNWVLGFETDFSLADLSGTATATSPAAAAQGTVITQLTTVQQSTDWYGTVRGRLGWLATPNLLLFGTGGFAYGRVSDSANYGWSGLLPSGFGLGIIVNDVFGCVSGPLQAPFAAPGPPVCNTGTSASVRTGWTGGGGVEWLLDQHWSAKIEYQFVDLGSQTVRVTNLLVVPAPSSFNAVFHDRFNVVRLGLNYHF